jgi:transcriptional regulator with XRE-family HTH domain
MKKKKVGKVNPAKKRYLEGLGLRIREIRMSRELTQTELAEKINNHQRTITRLERAEINASIFLVKEIADALGVPIEELLTGIGK